MGCPSGTCTGYELRADLTFDENGDGQMTATGDPTYWNSGSGWQPLGYYAAAFQGNGQKAVSPLRSISHLQSSPAVVVR